MNSQAYPLSVDDLQLLRNALAGSCPINTTNRVGETALHLAVKNRDLDAAVDLIRKEAALLPKHSGETALHYAASNNDYIHC